MPLRSRTLATLLTGATIVTGAGTAQAATVAESAAGTVVTIDTRDLSQSFVEVTLDGTALLVTGGDGSGDPYFFTPLSPGAGCTTVSVRQVRCAGYAAYNTVIVGTGGGPDTFWVFANLAAEIDADLGDGPDSFLADENQQRVVARGGGGTDSLTGGGASDRLEGGPGSDGLGGGRGGVVGAPGGNDELIGGDGFDMVIYADRSANLRLSLDSVANDGDPSVGEQDNLIDIEDVTGGAGNDVITGDAEANNLFGSEGNDQLDGGAGFDSYNGFLGNDAIKARDGLSERVVCEQGTDTAETDDIDRTVDCEQRSSSPDLQPDRDGDGVDAPLDCNDLDPLVRPGAFDAPGNGRDEDCTGVDAVDNDRDRDGFTPPSDCDDANAAVHPGVEDVAGNSVDEDCDGVNEPFPRATALAMLAWRLGPVATQLVALAVGDLDGGETVVVRCKGKGCRFARRVHRAKPRAELLRLTRDVRGMRLQPGATLSVAVTRRDGVTKVIAFRIRSGKPPARSQRCTAPGGGAVEGC